MMSTIYKEIVVVNQNVTQKYHKGLDANKLSDGQPSNILVQKDSTHPNRHRFDKQIGKHKSNDVDCFSVWCIDCLVLIGSAVTSVMRAPTR